VINATSPGRRRLARRAVRVAVVGLAVGVTCAAGTAAWRAIAVGGDAADRASVLGGSAGGAAATAAVDVLGGSAAGAAVPSTAGLTARLDGMVRGAGLGGQGAAAVVDAATGRTLCGYQADQMMPPASTDKIATALAALERMSGTSRLVTRVVQQPGTDRVTLVGGGDVTLSSDGGSTDPDFRPASMRALAISTAAVLKARGMTSIQLSYDASVFGGPALARSWSAGGVSGSIAPVSGLEADEGRIVPGREFSGRVGDPARAAAEAFAGMLRAAGLTVTDVAAGAAPAGAQPVAQVESPPLTDLVEHMLTVSDDDLAEALGHLVARSAGQPATFDGAAAAALATLRALGIDTGEMQLVDSSGLSHADRISPAALAGMLAVAASAAHPELRATLSGLPIAGFTGTLGQGRFTAASAVGVGVVRAKTGTLDGVATEAGVVEDADGRLLAYAVMADKAPDATVTRRQLDRFAAALVGCGCR
jgi:D-alanyl-D-alanine carboxypeptidase/D-alanyl-D-alanine-endopeptidase (penicillin-binding protein 4)